MVKSPRVELDCLTLLANQTDHSDFSNRHIGCKNGVAASFATDVDHSKSEQQCSAISLGARGWLQRAQLIATLLLLSGSSAFAADIPDVSGIWKPIGSDDRLMTIRAVSGKITIEARELSCTLTDLRPAANDVSRRPAAVSANSVCYEESYTIYAKETLSVLRVGLKVILINATVLLRQVNDNLDPRMDQTYTNQPAEITVYRRVRTIGRVRR
jgi:hypothetical protein